MRTYILLLLFISSLSAEIDNGWLELVKSRKPGEKEKRLITEIKENLKEIKPEGEVQGIISKSRKELKKKCRFFDSVLLEDADHSLLVAMTFDLPDSVWVELSPQIEKLGGAFILRGLPENSFSILANKLKALSEKGVSANINIDPKAFEEYSILSAPSFIAKDKRGVDKISGNITLSYALEKMAFEGETDVSKELFKKLKGGA